MARQAIRTNTAPAAVGPYSQAVVSGNMVFVSGQLGMDPQSGNLVEGGVENQASQAIGNLRAVLIAAGCDLKNVVKATVYLADIADFSAMNEVYKSFFTGPDYPARAAFQVAALPKGAKFEIEAIAVKGS